MARRIEGYEIATRCFAPFVQRGLGLQVADDEVFDGRHVSLDGTPFLNFASCSYLALERDSRLKAGAIDALERFGTQFSCSRTYLSAPAYREFEELLERLFDGPVLPMPNTTLGHFSTLPLVVDRDDAVILDHQVHESVQMAVGLIKARGNHVEIVRHSRMDRLEERIRKLSSTHPHVWYMCDGIFSMCGDPAPIKALSLLLARYPALRLYIDDAHGMSWCGRHGRGSVLDALPNRERVIVTFSLNKAFAAAGGAVVFPNEELRERVRLCGGPSRFSGPIQPPMLGIGIASARIHLSDEIGTLQEELRERIQYFNRGASERGIPLVNFHDCPIRFIGAGSPEGALELGGRLYDEKIFASAAPYPVVPRKLSGVRFSITRAIEHEDIDRALDALERLVPVSLAACGLAIKDVHDAFNLDPPESSNRAPVSRQASSSLRLEYATSISDLDTEEWDRAFAGRGHFLSDGLRMLERAFGSGDAPEAKWGFHYFRVRDASGRLVAAAHFTDALWKDDMLASVEVSKLVEKERGGDPYYLTTRVFSAGNLLSQGSHHFFEPESDWKGGLSLILEAARAEAEKADTRLFAFRDVGLEDVGLREYLAGAGFTEVPAPAAMELDVTWSDRAGYLRTLSKRARAYLEGSVFPFEDRYEVEMLGAGHRVPTEAELDHMEKLYEAVRSRSLWLNTFALPRSFFEHAARDPAWETFALRLRDVDEPLHQVYGVCYRAGDDYTPLVLGMDYRFVHSHGPYYRGMLEAISRAQQVGAKRIRFGLSAEVAKRRVGAVPVQSSVYIQADDHFHSDVVEWMSVGLDSKRRR